MKEDIDVAVATPREIAEAVSDRPTFLKKVRIKYKNWWEKCLSFLFILPRYRTLSMTNPCPATVHVLVSIYHGLTIEKGEDEELANYLLRLTKENLPDIIDCIAHAIHNAEGNPDKWIYDALWYNFEMDELRDISAKVYRGLDLEPFFDIIASIRAVRMMDIIGIEARGQDSAAS